MAKKSKKKRKVITRVERVLLTRFHNVFREPIYHQRLEAAVIKSHKFFESALFLSKLIILQNFEDLVKENGNVFDHDLAIEFVKRTSISKEYFGHLLTVVSTKDGNKSQGRPHSEENLEKVQYYKQRYNDYLAQGVLLPNEDGTNLSHVFAGLEVQMMTSYQNNIATYMVESVKSLTKSQNDDRKNRCGKLIKLLIYSDNEEENDSSLETWEIDIYDQAKTRYPPNIHPSEWKFKIKRSMTLFLVYMINLNRELELMGTRTLSPLPIRLHYIPGSITIDTSGLVDILVQSKQDFMALRKKLSESGYDMTKFTSKGQLYKAVTNFIPTANPAKFKTAIWRHFCNLDSRMRYNCRGRRLKFNNVMTLDGHKVGIHYVSPESYGITKFTDGVVLKGTADKESSIDAWNRPSTCCRQTV
ncbi:hypothetical protein HDU76_005388 [Blyttiomyces sp. JEL0837]|nr:hypothetical protein HDU76_005388 [Blyttiomyces sp. JEL0837]